MADCNCTFVPTYDGTIFTPKNPVGPTLFNVYKEFFPLGIKRTNSLEIIVKCSGNAEILLHNGNPDNELAVKIVIGTEGNQKSSIGFANNSNYAVTSPSLTACTCHVLNSAHFKAFTITWRYGLIQVFNEGFEKPFLAWKGPESLIISHFGVRARSSSAVWRVQGSKEFNSTESDEFRHFKVMSGRLDFELKAKQDAYIVFTTEPKDGAKEVAHVFIGGWSNGRCALFRNKIELAAYAEPKVLSMGEYRRFWVKWDTTSMQFGVFGEANPKMSWYNVETPLHEINYFSMVTTYNSDGYWHFLDQGPETAEEARCRQGLPPIREKNDNADPAPKPDPKKDDPSHYIRHREV